MGEGGRKAKFACLHGIFYIFSNLFAIQRGMCGEAARPGFEGTGV